ncbi:MAG TPA: vWA domain-containing protein [Bryobacteraceae bacterium]|nr:vWA domain-containing protein [Bryobacteraceae bacterium]
MTSQPVRRKTTERGSVSVLFAVTMVFLLVPIVGLAIDAGVAYVIKAKLSAAVDAATLAAARSLSIGQDVQSQANSAGQTALAYFNANFPDGLMNAHPTMPWSSDPNNGNVQQTSAAVRTVTITASAVSPLYFLSLFGQKTVTVAASGQASRRDVNVVMVLDRSGSMATSGVCGTMKASAASFVDKFSNGRDRLGLITFKGSAHVDFPSNLSFKPDLQTLIGTLQCAGNTGTAQALYLAHQQFLSNGSLIYPGALNVILFFTDGLPNGIAAQYLPKGNCTSKNPPYLNGFLADGPSGVFDTNGGLISDTSEHVLNSNQATGCAFQPSGSSRVVNDVVGIPASDLFGSKIYPGFWSLPSIPIPITNTNINNASLNAADDAANNIRNDNITIYCIGESKSVDSTFLKRVANTTDAIGYKSTQPSGLYVYSPDGGQLSSAFETIASQLLRISQ